VRIAAGGGYYRGVFARPALLLLACLMGACVMDRGRGPMHPENPPGRWYVVAEGETVADIGRREGVPPEDILEINGLERPDQVVPGKLLYLLEGRPGVPGGSEVASTVNKTPGETPARSLPTAGRLRWPLPGAPVGSPFGTRGGKPHEGIDLPAPIGTPVFAAADGKVVYAGNGIRGYGNLIVVQHPGDLLTVYAHNSQLLVRQGDQVSAGQKVALVGQTGHATGPHLHFEVRQGQIPRDPMTFLGAPPAMGGSP
jgi:murein DD-endopeptidase MepM/ murein hydrolase activator NlpD